MNLLKVLKVMSEQLDDFTLVLCHWDAPNQKKADLGCRTVSTACCCCKKNNNKYPASARPRRKSQRFTQMSILYNRAAEQKSILEHPARP